MEDSTQLTTTTSQDLALIPEMDDAMTRMAASTIKFTDKVASYTLKFMVFYAVLCVYVLNQLNTLPRCSSGRRCATPMLDLTQDVDVLIHASLSGDVDTNVAPTYVARNASGKSYDATIPLSADVRKGGAPLTAHAFLLPSRQGDWDWSNDTAALARAFFVGSAPLTVLRRVTSQRMKPRKLLQADAYVDRDDVGSTASHWRFGRWPLVVRMLDAGELDYERAILEQQHHLGVGIRARHGRYFPVVHVDESLALATHALPISRNTSFPGSYPQAPGQDGVSITFWAAEDAGFSVIAVRGRGHARGAGRRATVADLGPARLSLCRAAARLLSTRGLRLPGFFRGRRLLCRAGDLSWYIKSLSGVEPGARFDSVPVPPGAGGGFSCIIWADAGFTIGLLQDPARFKACVSYRPRFPLFFIVTAPLRTPPAKATAKYDKEATSHLYLATFPMLFGVALYSLVHDVHRTYYGWIVSSLADLVYYFGFIMMTPQLYINYKLQSVAHLPIRVFAYKIFNTFVDDVFAWVVKMPLKHRLMTLRDDVVFVVFLYQTDVHRIDSTRRTSTVLRRTTAVSRQLTRRRIVRGGGGGFCSMFVVSSMACSCAAVAAAASRRPPEPPWPVSFPP